MMQSRKNGHDDKAAIEMPASAIGIESAVEWFRRQGHKIVISTSACWYDAAPRIFQAFPYHRLITPTEDELRQVFREGRAAGLRYSAPPTSPVGKISYHVVYSKPVYSYDDVSRTTAQNIRRGFSHGPVEPISFARLAEEGWALRAETLARQGRLKAENRAWWKSLCLSAEGLPGFEAWGVLHEGELVAALIAYRAGDCYLMLYQQSRTDHLKFGVNNSLVFVFTQQTLARPGVKRIFQAHQSLDASSDIDLFKFRMGYTAEPVRQRVLFHPALRPLVSPATLTAMDYLGRTRLGGPRWLKAAGMMRFCLEGNRPPSQQSCPGCLLDRREELFGV